MKCVLVTEVIGKKFRTYLERVQIETHRIESSACVVESHGSKDNNTSLSVFANQPKIQGVTLATSLVPQHASNQTLVEP